MRHITATAVALVVGLTGVAGACSSSSSAGTCTGVVSGQDPVALAATAATLPGQAGVFTVQAEDSSTVPGTKEVTVKVCAGENVDPATVAYPVAKAVQASGQPVSVLTVTTWTSNEKQTGTARAENFQATDWATVTSDDGTTAWTITEN